MSTLIAEHNNRDPADVEFDFVQVTSVLPIAKLRHLVMQPFVSRFAYP
jgi:hypothetical protein